MYALKFRFLQFLIIICLLFFSSNVLCQSYEYLLVEKPGTSNRHIFRTGDKIKLKLSGESVYLSGTIELLLDSSLVVEGHAIRLNEIEKIKIIRSGELMPKIIGLSYKLPVAGILLMLFEGISAELQNENPLVEENTMVIAAALIASGIALGTIKNKTIILSKRYKAKIVKINLVN